MHEQIDTVIQDARYALRGFRRNRAFAIAAVLAIALGIGSGAAVFSVVDRILFRSLPYPAEDRLVSLGFLAPLDPQEFGLTADYLEWRDAQAAFESMTSWSGVADCDLTDGNPVRLACARVEATFLPTLGVSPIVGRNFTREEDQPNAPPVALLSYGLWQSRFGGDRNVPGRTISLDGRPARIAGVLPPDFELPTLARFDLLVPQALNEAVLRDRKTIAMVRIFARLKPGMTIAQADARMQPLFQQSLNFVPPQFRKEVRFRIRSLRDRQVQDAKLASWVLLGSVLAVLLIACANVANLLLARGLSRQRELAVRAALGAGRARLLRQMLTESVMLGAIGGVAGCGLATLLLRLFVSIAPNGILRLEQASLDARVLALALGASLLSGLLFGLSPALHIPGPSALAGWRAAGSTRNVFRHAFVTAQIAVSLVLLAGAGLLLRSLWNLQRVPLGMRTDNVLTAAIGLGPNRYPTAAQQAAFYDELESRLRRIPGIAEAAISDSLPPYGAAATMIYSVIDVEGRPPASQGTGGMVVWRAVTPGYFAALGIPIVRGRGFTDEDRQSSANTIILSDVLARRMFPGEDPLGKRLRPGRVGEWRTVTGIARNVKNNGLAGADDPEYYVPRIRAGDPTAGRMGGFLRRASLIVRSPLDPHVVAAWVRQEIAAIDPSLPVNLETMETRVGKLSDRPRFNAFLLATFAGMGVLLAAVGLYGVVSFLVAQRTREIGVRMALGATSRSIARMVLGDAFRWSLSGAVLGLAGSFFAARFLRALLFGVKEHDLWAPAAAVALLLGVALAAAWAPSRRASRVDPMRALRHD